MIACEGLVYAVVMCPRHKANGYKCYTADQCSVMEEKILLHKQAFKKIAPKNGAIFFEVPSGFEPL